MRVAGCCALCHTGAHARTDGSVWYCTVVPRRCRVRLGAVCSVQGSVGWLSRAARGTRDGNAMHAGTVGHTPLYVPGAASHLPRARRNVSAARGEQCAARCIWAPCRKSPAADFPVRSQGGSGSVPTQPRTDAEQAWLAAWLEQPASWRAECVLCPLRMQPLSAPWEPAGCNAASEPCWLAARGPSTPRAPLTLHACGRAGSGRRTVDDLELRADTLRSDAVALPPPSPVD